MSSVIEGLRREAEAGGEQAAEAGGEHAPQRAQRAPKPLASGKQVQVFEDDGEEEGGGGSYSQAYSVPQPRRAVSPPRHAPRPPAGAHEAARRSTGSDDGSEGSESVGGGGGGREGGGGETDARRRERMEARAARLRANEEREAKQLVQRRSDTQGRGGGGSAIQRREQHSAFGKDTGLRTSTTKLDHQDVFGKRSSVADGLLDGKTTRKAAAKGGPSGGLDLDVGSLARSGHGGAAKERRAAASHVRSSAGGAPARRRDVDDDDDDSRQAVVLPVLRAQTPEKRYSRHLPQQAPPSAAPPRDEAALLQAELAKLKRELAEGAGANTYDISSSSDEGEGGPGGGNQPASSDSEREPDIKELRRQREAKSLDKFKRMPANVHASEVRVSVDLGAKQRSQALRDLNREEGGVHHLYERDEESSEGEGEAEIPAHRLPGSGALAQMGKTGSVIFCPECGEPSPAGTAFCSCSEPLGGDTDYGPPASAAAPSPPPSSSASNAPAVLAPQPAADTRPSTAQSGTSTSTTSTRAPSRGGAQPRPPSAISEASQESSDASEAAPAAHARVRIQTSISEASESTTLSDNGSSAHEAAPSQDPALRPGAFPKAPPSRRRRVRQQTQPDEATSPTPARPSAAASAAPEASAPAKQSPQKSSYVKESAPPAHLSPKKESSPAKPSPKRAAPAPQAAKADAGSTEDDAAWKARALMEADDLLSSMAPPRLHVHAADAEAPKAAPASSPGAPMQSPAKEVSPMMDPFLRSLGGPAVHTDWDDDSASQAGGRDEEDSMFSKGTEKLLKLQGKPADKRGGQNAAHRGHAAPRRPDVGVAETSFASQATSQATATSVYSVIMDAAVVKALREAKALLDEGVLTQEEFQAQKAIILNQRVQAQEQASQRHASERHDHSNDVSASSHGGGRHGERLTNAERARVLSGLNDDDDDGEDDGTPPPSKPVAVGKMKYFDNIAHHVTTDESEGQAPVVHMMRPPSASTVVSECQGAPQQPARGRQQHRPPSASTSVGTIGNFMRAESGGSGDGGFARAGSAGTEASGGDDGEWEAGGGDAGEEAPLFLRDHNEEVERLQAMARRELEAASEMGYEDDGRTTQYGDDASEYGTEPDLASVAGEARVPAALRQSAESHAGGPAERSVITTKEIRDTWRQREASIAASLEQRPPSFADFPAPAPPGDAGAGPSPGSTARSMDSSVASSRAGPRPGKRSSHWRTTWGADGVEEEGDGGGWGSDVSSGDDAPYVPPAYRDPFEPEMATPPAAAVKAAGSPRSQTTGTVAGEARELSPAGRAAAAALAAEADKIEREARLLREAAQHAREQEEGRRAAERDAEAARAEAEMLRKQLAAMDDRVKASKRLEERIKQGAVADALELILAAALAQCVPPDPEPCFDAFGGKGEPAGAPQQQQQAPQPEAQAAPAAAAGGLDGGVGWEEGEGDGEEEVRAWQAKRSAAQGRHHAAAAAKHAANKEQILAKAAERGGGTPSAAVMRRPAQAPIVREDISSTSDEGEGDEETDEEGGAEEELDPALLAKLRLLSAVLIQRAYRSFAARTQARRAAQRAKEAQRQRRASVLTQQAAQPTPHKAPAQPPQPAEKAAAGGKAGASPAESAGGPAEGEDSLEGTGRSGGGGSFKSRASASAEGRRRDNKGEALRAFRAALRARDFDDAAEAFVYMEHNGNDFITVQELERGAKMLRLGAAADVPGVIAAIGKRGAHDRIAYKDFMRHFSWGAEASVSALGALEAARLRRRAIADRVQKAASASEEMQRRRATLDKKRDEAWEQLSALRRQLGPASARSARGSRSERAGKGGSAAAGGAQSGRGAGFHTTREEKRRTRKQGDASGASTAAPSRQGARGGAQVRAKGGASDTPRQVAAACIVQACARRRLAGAAHAQRCCAALSIQRAWVGGRGARPAPPEPQWEVDGKGEAVGRQPRVWSDSESDEEEEGWLGLGGGKRGGAAPAPAPQSGAVPASAAVAAAAVAAAEVAPQAAARGGDAAVNPPPPPPARVDAGLAAKRREKQALIAALLAGDSSSDNDGEAPPPPRAPAASAPVPAEAEPAPAEEGGLAGGDAEGSARVLQRVYRGHLGRVVVVLERRFQRAERREAAATLIQKHVRGMAVRARPTPPQRAAPAKKKTPPTSEERAVASPETATTPPHEEAAEAPGSGGGAALSSGGALFEGYVDAFPSRGNTPGGDGTYPSRGSSATSSVAAAAQWGGLESLPVPVLASGAQGDPFPLPSGSAPPSRESCAGAQEDGAPSRTGSAASRTGSAGAQEDDTPSRTGSAASSEADLPSTAEGAPHAHGGGADPFVERPSSRGSTAEGGVTSGRGRDSSAASEGNTSPSAAADGKSTPTKGRGSSAESASSSAFEGLRAAVEHSETPARDSAKGEGRGSPSKGSRASSSESGRGTPTKGSSSGMPPKAPAQSKVSPLAAKKAPAAQMRGSPTSVDVLPSDNLKRGLRMKLASKKSASEAEGGKVPAADAKKLPEDAPADSKPREFLKAKKSLRQPSSELKSSRTKPGACAALSPHPQTLFLAMDEPDEQAHARWVMAQLAGDLGPPLFPDKKKPPAQPASTPLPSTQNTQFLTSKPPMPRSQSALGLTFTPLETVLEERERLSTAGSVDLESVHDASRGSTRQSNRALNVDDARGVEEVFSFLKKLRTRMRDVQALEEQAASREMFREAAEHQEELAKLKEGEARLLRSIATLLGKGAADVDVDATLFSGGGVSVSGGGVPAPSSAQPASSTVKQVVPRYMNMMGVNSLGLITGGKSGGKPKQSDKKAPLKLANSAYVQALRSVKQQGRSGSGGSMRAAWPPADHGGDASKHSVPQGERRGGSCDGGMSVPVIDSDSDEEATSSPERPHLPAVPALHPGIRIASSGAAAARYAARQHVSAYEHELNRSASR